MRKPNPIEHVLDPASIENTIYRFIIEYKIANDGNSPTMREIGRHTGIRSTSLVTFYLTKLEQAGLIQQRDPATARAIRLVGGAYVFKGCDANAIENQPAAGS